jgi:hypothetical protein
MRNNCIIVAFGLMFLSFLTFSCKKDGEVNIESFQILKDKEKVVAGSTSAMITGVYSYSGTINSIKVQVGTNENFYSSDEFTTVINNKAYAVEITGLEPHHTYYYRYLVDYGGKKDLVTEYDQFTTTTELPVVQTIEVLPLDSISVRVTGNVISDGGVEITERGICWNTYGNPDLEDDFVVYEIPGLGEYTCRITDLAASTNYHARAYAKNAMGIPVFGEDVPFQTGSSLSLPTVKTLEIKNITVSSAICVSKVMSSGGSEVTERGVCWSSTHLFPNLEDNHESSGSGVGEYNVTMTGLEIDTKYYVRSYAINAQGIPSYSEPRDFHTSDGKPTVITVAVTEITANSAVCGGNVVDEGESSVSERGICWNTHPEPTINDPHGNSGTGPGSYSVNMDGLTSGVTCYVRAYAKNSFGIAYGDTVSFIPTDGLPVVETTDVTNITSNSAVCGGNVREEGASSVIRRGVCWSRNHNPTTQDHDVPNGTGLGEFSCNITGLSSHTDYYVRAYATNAVGTAYGTEKTIPTLQGKPSVTTAEVTDFTYNTATVTGEVTNDGGSTVSESGFCWSTSPNPTLEDSHVEVGQGMGVFSSQLANLHSDTKYYVRAYAINAIDVGYGNQVDFTTLMGPGAPVGAAKGLFTVGPNKQVWFAQGNLQYQASTNIWHFADEQTEYIGTSNSQISATNPEWIDLFGWATSNYNHNNACYQPWSTSDIDSDYYAYGNYQDHLFSDSGKADWGYNAISNGGNTEHSWRTLTSAEWVYVFKHRDTPSGILYAKASIETVNGVILLPDDWDATFFDLNSPNLPEAKYNSNVISLEEWKNELEPLGAVFLPTGGYRNKTNMYGVNNNGYYWASTGGSEAKVYYVKIQNYSFDPGAFEVRHYGYSVRLVQDF